MPWWIFALLSVAFFTALNLLQKTVAEDSEHPRMAGLTFNIEAALCALILFLVTGQFREFSLPSDFKPWAFALFAVITYGFFERGRFYAAKLLDASIFTTIFNLSVAVSFFGSVLLYKESLSVTKVIGLGILLFAMFLASFEKKANKISFKGVFIAVAISISIGLAWVADKEALHSFPATTYNLLVWLFPMILVALPSFKPKKLIQEIKNSSWKSVVLAMLNVAAFYFQLQAVNQAPVSQVIPFIQTSTITTILLGIILLKETERIPRKIIGGILAITGVVLIAMQ